MGANRRAFIGKFTGIIEEEEMNREDSISSRGAKESSHRGAVSWVASIGWLPINGVLKMINPVVSRMQELPQDLGRRTVSLRIELAGAGEARDGKVGLRTLVKEMRRDQRLQKMRKS